jgi:hypothetical protein
MSALPQKLLSTALRVKWESGHSQDRRAVELLAERVPGFTAEMYAEANRRAAELDSLAYQLAAAWFARQGQGPYPTVDVPEAHSPASPALIMRMQSVTTSHGRGSEAVGCKPAEPTVSPNPDPVIPSTSPRPELGAGGTSGLHVTGTRASGSSYMEPVEVVE